MSKETVHLDNCFDAAMGAIKKYVEDQTMPDNEKLAISHATICLMYKMATKQLADPFKDKFKEK